MPTLHDNKHCPRCLETKPRTNFYNNRSNPDGKDSYCKLCRHEITRNYTHHLTPVQRAARRVQKQEYARKKYGVPYEPYRIKKERADNRARDLSSSTDQSKSR